MSVGERLILLRKTLDINQSDMAMVMGCTQGNISRYEKDGTIMSIKYLIPLRKAYNVNLDWLLLGRGEMFQPETYVQPPVEITSIKKSANPTKKDKMIKKMNELSAELHNTWQELSEYLDE